MTQQSVRINVLCGIRDSLKNILASHEMFSRGFIEETKETLKEIERQIAEIGGAGR